MNVALIGSVSSSYYCLDALIQGGVEVTGVLGLDESRADVVSDYRSLRALAGNAGLPFLSFVKVVESHVEAFVRRHPPDLLWVIGLSQLVPDRLIGIARFGGVGFHPTMLPHGRGRAPVAWTILKDERAAVSLFFLTDQPDAGDIIAQRKVSVSPDDYSEDLIQRTNEVLAKVVLELAPSIIAGTIPRTPQDHSRATFYSKRTPADGLIDWSESTDKVYRLIRASGRPYPGAFSFWDGHRVTIWRARPASATGNDVVQPPIEAGTILHVDAEQGVLVQTADGALWLTEAVLEGASGSALHNVAIVGAIFTAGQGNEER